MNKILTCLAAVLISLSAIADQHNEVETEVRDALSAFNRAYGSNDLEDYFRNFTDDATLYWDGARHQVSEYYEQWKELVDAGGAVEKNELSDVRVRVMPGGKVAVATYFIDYQLRLPDGEVSGAKAFETDVWQMIDDEWKVVSVHYTEIAAEE